MNISVIIPVYNRIEFLIKALDSVLAQTHPPSEIIIVDDGSAINVETELRKGFLSLSCLPYGMVRKSEKERVIFLRQENKGVSAARNLGLSKSSGDWIALLDSDDYWLPEKLAAQVSFHKENPKLLISQTNEIWIRNGVRINPNKHNLKIGGDIFEQSLGRCMISPSAVIFHKSLIDECGSFDEALPACEDYDLWLRITCRNKVGLIKENLVVKTGGHDDQLSKKYEAMDSYRLQSLLKLIESGVLSDEQLKSTLEVLVSKAQILKNGAIKRKKSKLTIYFDEIIKLNSIKCRSNIKV